MTLSVIAHTFYCKDKEHCERCWLYDHLGICFCIYGSIAGAVFMLYLDNPKEQQQWNVFFFLALLSMLFITYYTRDIDKRPKVLGIFALLMGTLGVYLTIDSELFKSHGIMKHVSLMMFSSLIPILLGMVVYFSNLTERFFGDRVSLIGHSHNLWHILVIIGSVCFPYVLWKFLWGYDLIQREVL